MDINLNKLKSLMKARKIGTGELARRLNWKPDAVLKMIHSKRATSQAIIKVEIILDGKITGGEQAEQEKLESYFSHSITRILVNQRSTSQLILCIEEKLINPTLLLKYEKERADPRAKLVAYLEKYIENEGVHNG